MDNMTKMAEFLQTFGGWGLSIILIAAIMYLYRSMNSLLEQRNQQFIDALRETTAVLQQSHDESRRVEALLQRVERLLDS